MTKNMAEHGLRHAEDVDIYMSDIIFTECFSRK